jgi:hypothetical protein
MAGEEELSEAEAQAAVVAYAKYESYSSKLFALIANDWHRSLSHQ